MASHTGGGKCVGYLSNGRMGPMFESFMAGVAALKHEVRRNIVVEPRFAQGDTGRLSTFASELVALGVDAIAASGAVAARAAQQVTSNIPIVFAAVLSPPALVDIGLAASAQRPGANITGFSSFDPDQASKSFRLLKQMLPRLKTVALVSDRNVPHSPTDPGWNPLERAYDNAARAEGLRTRLVRMGGPAPDLDALFAQIVNDDAADAVVVLEMPVTLQHLERLAAMANARALPAMLPAGHPNHGALVNFGSTISDANRAMAGYIEEVLNGTHPGELPIGVSNRTELIINLATAEGLGIAIPSEISESADRLLT